MSRVLILSPHPDDAVLSCGGRIAQTVEAGGAVMVATCFTSPGEGVAEELQGLYEGRRADDAAVMGWLGVEFRHWGFVDAPFRNAAYYNFNTILFHHDFPPEERTLVQSLGKRVLALVEEWRPDEVLFPLGVGGHIDHHLVWESSKALWGAAAGSAGDAIRAIGYYEELPYALIPGWSAVRWNELGGRMELRGSDQPSGNSQKMNLLEVPYPFVKNYMPSGEDRVRSVDKYNREYGRLSDGMWDSGLWTLDGVLFARNLYQMSDRYLADKCRAIAGYHSEWPVLFGPEEGTILRMLAGTMNATDYTEISWTLKTTQ